jgi:hypothetical protein
LAGEARRYAGTQVGPFVAACLLKFLHEQGDFKLWWQVIRPETVAKSEPNQKSKKQIESLGKREVTYTNDETGEKTTTSLIRLLAQACKQEGQVIKRHSQNLRLAEIALAKAEQVAESEVKSLIRELYERKDEPRLIEAASSWTNAPDGDGYLGPGGRGLSGGYTHLFLYRGHRVKRKRFEKIPELQESMTVEGFIALTDRLRIQTDLAEMLLDRRTMPTENDLVVLCDAHGRRRYYIKLPDGELIIAYQKPGQDVKLSTLIPGCSNSYLRTIITSARGEENKIRINKLGPDTVVEFSNVPKIKEG